MGQPAAQQGPLGARVAQDPLESEGGALPQRVHKAREGMEPRPDVLMPAAGVVHRRPLQRDTGDMDLAARRRV